MHHRQTRALGEMVFMQTTRQVFGENPKQQHPTSVRVGFAPARPASPGRSLNRETNSNRDKTAAGPGGEGQVARPPRETRRCELPAGPGARSPRPGLPAARGTRPAQPRSPGRQPARPPHEHSDTHVCGRRGRSRKTGDRPEKLFSACANRPALPYVDSPPRPARPAAVRPSRARR